METKIKGRAIKYGDHIDTDVIIWGPHLVHGHDMKEISRFAMENIDPDFRRKLGQGGSIIVGGRNFGCGSSRQQSCMVLKESGIKAVLAESIGRIFFRNSINIGLPALIVEGISREAGTFDEVEIDLEEGKVNIPKSGKQLQFQPLPPFLMEILEDGGLIPHIKRLRGSR